MIATFQIHNEQTINDNLRTVVTAIRPEIRAAENLHVSLFGVSVHALDHFDAWLQNLFTGMMTWTQIFLIRCTNHLEIVGDSNAQIMAPIPQLRTVTNGLVIT